MMPTNSVDVIGKRCLPCLRWAFLLILLVAEVLGLTLRFDTDTVIVRQGWLPDVIAQSPRFISVCTSLVMVIGLFLYLSVQGNQELRRLAEPVGPSRWLSLWLPGHLAAFAALCWLTQSVFEGSALSSSPTLWVSLWISAGVATLVLWMAVALPLDRWYRLVRSCWKPLLFGIVVSVLAVAVGRSTSTLWGSFHGSTFWAVRRVLGLFYSDLICEPDDFSLGTPVFWVSISSQCSGYEGIGLIWVFLGVFFWLFRHELRFPHALLLIPLGTAMSWGANVARIAALIVVGDRGWPAVALGGFHSQAGWLAFNAIGVGLVLLSRRVRLFSKLEPLPEPQPATAVNPTAAYVGPLLAIAVTMMVTAAISEGGFDRFYPARVLAALAIFWCFRREYTALSWSWSWHALAVGLGVFAIWTALEPAPESTAAITAIPDSLSRLPRPWAATWLSARVIGSVAVIPLAEELAFRGYLTRRLIAADFLAVPEGRFTWPSFLLSSVLFGLLHQRWIAGTIAGMLYALVYYRRGKLADAVLAHAATNLSITIYVLSTGQWYAWS